MTAPWVILGCGYTGERVAARLREAGVPVSITVRRPEAAAALGARLGVPARALDVAAPGALDGWLPARPIVVDSIPPGDAPSHAAAVVAAVAAAGGGRVVYLSTTGVYGRADGAWIDEDTPVAPHGPGGALRVAMEQAYADAARATGGAVEVVSLRIAAIYGPGRGVHERLRAGTYAVPGDGTNMGNRIHVDDLASVVVAAGRATPLRRDAYVVADDHPATSREVADGVAALMGLPPPPSVPLEALPPMARELASGNRRVRNTRLHDELGVTLRYPSFREGVAACLRNS